MKTKFHITDGSIERFVLGFSTPEEEEELHLMKSQFPEIFDEMEEVERGIERMALKHAPIPPVEVKRSVMEIIQREIERKTGNAPVLSRKWEVIENIVSEDVKEQREKPLPSHMTIHKAWMFVLIGELVIAALGLLAILLHYIIHCS